MIVPICFNTEAKLFVTPAALTRSCAASFWDEAATRYKSSARPELRETTGNIDSNTAIIVEFRTLKISVAWRSDRSGVMGKLPEKYQIPSICVAAPVRSWRILMQGNVDRDSRSGDQAATIGCMQGVSMRQSKLLTVRVELHARR
jgi:hypothetical protein